MLLDACVVRRGTDLAASSSMLKLLAIMVKDSQVAAIWVVRGRSNDGMPK
jgi:hypothetical protein